jgi:hypothetical protein
MRLAQKGSIDVVQYVTFGSQNHKSNNDPNKLRMMSNFALLNFPARFFSNVRVKASPCQREKRIKLQCRYVYQ